MTYGPLLDRFASIDLIQPVNRLHPLNRGLVAWWLVLPGITGSSRLMDIVSPGPNGTHVALTNMDLHEDWRASSRQGGWGELDFDGTNDHGTFGDLGFSGNVAVSMSCWLYLTAGHTGNFPAAIALGNSPGIGTMLLVTIKFNRPALDFGDARLQVDFPISQNVWHHVVVTKSPGLISTTGKVYIDGYEAAATVAGDLTPNVTAGGVNATLGRLTSTAEYMTGRMDDVRVWDRPLTAEEVRWSYELGRQYYPGLLNRLPFTLGTELLESSSSSSPSSSTVSSSSSSSVSSVSSLSSVSSTSSSSSSNSSSSSSSSPSSSSSSPSSSSPSSSPSSSTSSSVSSSSSQSVSSGTSESSASSLSSISSSSSSLSSLSSSSSSSISSSPSTSSASSLSSSSSSLSSVSSSSSSSLSSPSGSSSSSSPSISSSQSLSSVSSTSGSTSSQSSSSASSSSSSSSSISSSSSGTAIPVASGRAIAGEVFICA